MRQKHLPNGLALETLEREYLGGLARYSGATIANLRRFLSRERSPDIDSAGVVVFPDESLEGRVSIYLYFEGRNKRIDQTDDSLFPGRSIEIVALDDLPTLDEEAYSELRLAHLFSDLAKYWFAECWWKAGGWDYELPVVMETHDDFGDGEVIVLTEATG